MISDNQRLVVSGPYRLVRHPMYRTYVLLFLAAFLMTGNWGIGSGGLSVIAVPMTARLIKEEALLVNRFGREYETYRGRTGKFFPRRGNGREAV